jgi:hypothetical protein
VAIHKLPLRGMTHGFDNFRIPGKAGAGERNESNLYTLANPNRLLSIDKQTHLLKKTEQKSYI